MPYLLPLRQVLEATSPCTLPFRPIPPPARAKPSPTDIKTSRYPGTPAPEPVKLRNSVRVSCTVSLSCSTPRRRAKTERAGTTVHPNGIEVCDDRDNNCDGVSDNLFGAIVCPADVVVECGGATGPEETGAPVPPDSCGDVLVTHADTTAGTCGETYVVTRDWTATDSTWISASCSQSITVVDTTPPRIDLPGASTLECNSLGGIPDEDPDVSAWLAAATAVDSCGQATVTVEAPPMFRVGFTPVIFEAVDSCGNTTIASSGITVRDTTPPVISIALAPAVLWPPNHRMVDITATVSASDVCSEPTVFLGSVSSSEPDDEPGRADGQTRGDIGGAEYGPVDLMLQLRAERAGPGNGRIYTATYTAADDTGNETSAEAYVVVPHDMRGSSDR